ncbi:MAG: hypothetical protein ACTSSP_07505 [Candidatus Asgardarchaeia archaeon]
MKKKYKLISMTENKAVIIIPSLKRVFKIPLDAFEKFAKKEVKITIEVKE